MANRQKHLLALAVLILSALPAQAQEAALDTPVGASGAPQMQTETKMVKSSPITASTGSNYMKNWSRFSQSSSSQRFLRVPPGTKSKGQDNVSHYVRPRCVVPGAVPVAAQQAHKGPVKRYLAYNVPISETVANKTAAVAVKPALMPASGRVVAQQQHVAMKKTMKPQTMAMGYGTKAGEVTYTPISSKWHGTAISCYGRYH